MAYHVINTAREGNYWSNWDGNGWSTPDAYPIDGGKASHRYPVGSLVGEMSAEFLHTVLLSSIALMGIQLRKR
ncbi:MAG: hypothetical protein QW115_02385 [Thermoplasmata archaeon]